MSRVIFSIFRGECCRNLPYSLKMMPEKILSFVYMLLILLPNFVNFAQLENGQYLFTGCGTIGEFLLCHDHNESSLFTLAETMHIVDFVIGKLWNI